MAGKLAGRALRTTLLLLVVALGATERQATGDAPPKERAKKAHGRLPAYYSAVVTQEQREQIYELQEQYKPKIKAIQTQLDALQAEMNEKITAVLTAEQKKKVQAAAEEAKAKRAKAKLAKVGPNAPPAKPEMAE